MKTMDGHWQVKHFDEFTVRELYDVLRLRTDVFVVEQNCPYAELDGRDTHEQALHMWQYLSEHGGAGRVMAACLRILPPGVAYDGVGLGRVAVHPLFRGRGLAHKMVDQAIDIAGRVWPGIKVEIGAQEYLTDFYKSHGFHVVSDPYFEDNILHIDMVFNPS